MQKRDYLAIIGYGEVYSGGRVDELFETMHISVTDTNYMNISYSRFLSLAEMPVGKIRGLNFDWGQRGDIVQSCGSLNRFKTCRWLLLGSCKFDIGLGYMLYDIQTRVIRIVGKNEIINSGLQVQNMSVKKETGFKKGYAPMGINHFGGVDKLIQFNPDYDYVFQKYNGQVISL